MICWGVDIGITSTGITAGDGFTAPAIDAWQFEDCGADLGRALECFETNLDAMAAERPPRAVVYEAPLLTKRDFASGRLLVLRKTYAMGAFLELWSRKIGAVCEEASHSALKKRLTGDHQAEKKHMVAMVRRLGLPLPKIGPQDAADSFAAWLVALEHHGDRAALTAWDQKLYGQRSGLL